VRGSTRAALDSTDGTVRERLMVNLQSFGRFWFVKKGANQRLKWQKKVWFHKGKKGDLMGYAMKNGDL
jgi:hypothetical protein